MFYKLDEKSSHSSRVRATLGRLLLFQIQKYTIYCYRYVNIVVYQAVLQRDSTMIITLSPNSKEIIPLLSAQVCNKICDGIAFFIYFVIGII